MRPLPLVLSCAIVAFVFPLAAAAQDPTPEQQFAEQITDPALADDERTNDFSAKPEIFLQTRFSRGQLEGVDPAHADHNFQLTRIETRWSGRLSDRIGVGLEFQFHPALEGAAEELVNDAFVEFYASGGVTIRAGQFIKPFGFDIQQSSADREYPERGMFAGYFFPGQRDRGLMVIATIPDHAPVLGRTQFYGAVLNGNRFFADNDNRLDTVVRVRRVVPSIGMAIGVSAQAGSQIVPPAVNDHGDVRIVGIDVQYAVKHLGLRAEWVHGTRPSTLLALEPEYTTAFAPNTTTTGVSAALVLSARPADQFYVRYDQLTGDPMGGGRIRAVDTGYRRTLGAAAHLSVDYQWKNAPTDNDDAVNTRVQATLGITF